MITILKGDYPNIKSNADFDTLVAIAREDISLRDGLDGKQVNQEYRAPGWLISAIRAGVPVKYVDKTLDDVKNDEKIDNDIANEKARDESLKRAKNDAAFRDAFVDAEMTKAGYSKAVIAFALFERDDEGKDISDLLTARKNKLAELKAEISNA